jgi:hypothetical protein
MLNSQSYVAVRWQSWVLKHYAIPAQVREQEETVASEGGHFLDYIQGSSSGYLLSKSKNRW